MTTVNKLSEEIFLELTKAIFYNNKKSVRFIHLVVGEKPMDREALFSEILNILDINLGLADTDKPRIRAVMTSLFNGEATKDALDLLRDMAKQQNEYASEGVEKIGCLELAHRLNSLADKLEKIQKQGEPKPQ